MVDDDQYAGVPFGNFAIPAQPVIDQPNLKMIQHRLHIAEAAA